jgi:hypothetical protein
MNVLGGTFWGECGWNIAEVGERLAQVFEIDRNKVPQSQLTRSIKS